MVRIGDVVAQKYRIERLLGRGGMGFVMAARHERLGHQVAIKILIPELCRSEEAVARFLREGRAAVSILSEHVARVLDVGTLEDDSPFMVMELLEGHDLSRELEHGVLPVRETVDYVLQACEALAEAHTLGIVHRDLKPANLFRTRRPDGSVVIKVLDFGISNMLPIDPPAASVGRLTDTKGLVGSPFYMSPEQVRNPKTIDPRSDVWSLGVILYELLTGCTPFGSDSTLSVLAGVVADEPRQVRSLRQDVSVRLQDVILKCLEKPAHRRYATVVKLAEALAVHTPTGEAAISRILAVVCSAEARARTARQGPARNANVRSVETSRRPNASVPTLEPTFPSVEARPVLRRTTEGTGRLRRRVVLVTGTLGTLGALLVGERVARWHGGEGASLPNRNDVAAASSSVASDSAGASCSPPGDAPATLTESVVAQATLQAELRSLGTVAEPEAKFIAGKRATSHRTAIATSPPPPHPIAGAKKDPAFNATTAGSGMAGDPLIGPAALDTGLDPLEGRQ